MILTDYQAEPSQHNLQFKIKSPVMTLLCLLYFLVRMLFVSSHNRDVLRKNNDPSFSSHPQTPTWHICVTTRINEIQRHAASSLLLRYSQSELLHADVCPRITHIQTAEGNLLLEMLQYQVVIREWRLVQAVWSFTPDLTDWPLWRATDVQISPFCWTQFHGKFMEAAEDAILKS